MCPTVLCSIDIRSVSLFTVYIDDTSDETEVSATASVWLILCAPLVCMLFSSKLVIAVVRLKEVCEFIITYKCSGIFQNWRPLSYSAPQTKSQGTQAPRFLTHYSENG